MEMYIWNTVIVLSKIVFYIGFASIAGYAFLRHIAIEVDKQFGWTKLAIFAALLANTTWFLASAGAMAEEGIQGAFDADMIELMWESSIGDATLLRVLGLAFALIAVASSFTHTSIKLNQNIKRGLLGLSIILLAYSYTVLGHVSELGLLEKALLMVHVFVMAWWFGALQPLKHACQKLDDKKLYLLMASFGKQASVMVALLLTAGLLLATQLVGSIDALFTTRYGQVLLLKLFLVVVILAIATHHKFTLVPQLENGIGRETLSKSILLETMVALAILSLTAVLTSVVGPAS